MPLSSTSHSLSNEMSEVICPMSFWLQPFCVVVSKVLLGGEITDPMKTKMAAGHIYNKIL